jgi:hypothetical protein
VRFRMIDTDTPRIRLLVLQREGASERTRRSLEASLWNRPARERRDCSDAVIRFK